MTFTFNPFDEAVRRDPFPTFVQARREHPAFRHAELPLISIFRYSDIHGILRDARTWSNRMPVPPWLDPKEVPQPSMLGLDAPEHTRLRALVNQAFTPRIIRQLEPQMYSIADELFDEALEKGDVDFVEAVTYPLPVIVIAEIIGIPPADRERFKVWSDALVADLGSGLFIENPDRFKTITPLLEEMSEYFTVLAQERRQHPQEDLLTGLVQAEVEGSKLTHDEMLRMVMLILVAGNETTTSLIGNMMIELTSRPEVVAQLRESPDFAESTVEEVLRFSSPVQLDPRRATQEIEVAGEVIKENEVVVLWLGSANRDESVFESSETFDIERKPNRHLAFGFGPHFCLGSSLARLEATVALRTLLRRTKSFARIDDAPLPLHPSIVFRGVKQLPVHLKPA